MSWCPKCDRYRFTHEQHSCPPLFMVQDYDCHNIEDEEDAQEIYAHDEEDAATEYGEKADSQSAEYSIVRGSTAKVRVKRMPSGEWKHFLVNGESVPQYYAKECSEETKP